MASTEIIIGILAPSAETRELLRIQVSATGMGSVEVEADQYCSAYGDRPTRRFVESRPDIVLIDMQDPRAAIQSLHVLHAALPDAWLFVSADITDSQLIIETMRAGAREFLPKPIPPRQLSQAFSRYATEKQRQQETATVGKIFAVTSAKGGSGVTSLSINLASSLADVSGAHVALVDLNSPVGDVVAHLNLKPQFTISDALNSASRLDKVLLESFMNHIHGIGVLSGPKEFQPGELPDVDALSKVLDVIARGYQYTVIDLPSTLDKEHLHLISEASTNVLVVSVAELPSLWRTERLIRYLISMGGADKLRLVINRSVKNEEITDSEIERVLKVPVFWKLPNNYKSSIRAINSGHPLVSLNHSDLARSYRELAFQLAGLPIPKKRGLLGFFQ